MLPLKERKGKGSKHKHSGGNSANSANNNNEDRQAGAAFPVSPTFLTPIDFKVSLDKVSSMLVAQALDDDEGPGGLQRMACHSTSGPFLTLLFKCLCLPAYSDRSGVVAKDLVSLRLGSSPMSNYCKFSSGASPAGELVEAVLQWADVTNCKTIIYGLSGEVNGSHLLEAICEHACEEVWAGVVERGEFGEKGDDYINHDVSNFVVQAVLRTCPSKTEFAKLATPILALIKSGKITAIAGKRRGVVHRVVEGCRRFGVMQVSWVVRRRRCDVGQ